MRCLYCREKFQPTYFLQKTCPQQSCKDKHNAANPVKQISRQSDKRKAQNDIYLEENKKFLAQPENRWCPVNSKSRTTEVHHMNGRTNKRLLDQSFWLAVSSDGHKWIHAHPKEAREKGWLI